MVIKQGDIIRINFDPTIGHEQAGYRPALVISNNTFNEVTNFIIVLPITNTPHVFPLHVPLDSRTQTTGNILCEHIKSIDQNARKITFVEQLPDDILNHVIALIHGEIEQGG